MKGVIWWEVFDEFCGLAAIVMPEVPTTTLDKTGAN